MVGMRNYPATGDSGWGCGAFQGWNEPKRGRIKIFGTKEVGKFLEREVSRKTMRVGLGGELDELGGRSQLDNVGQFLSGIAHLARMHSVSPFGYTLKTLSGAPV